MKRALLTLLFLMATALYGEMALAQVSGGGGRMQDLSLSPEDSMRQPNINNNPIEKQYQNDITRRSMSKDQPAFNAPPPRADEGMMPSKSFMEGFCDSNFVPLLANNRRYFGKEDCLKNLRDEACSRFTNLPKDAKLVLDEAISCMFTNGNGYASDHPSVSDNDYMVCGSTYARRIEMLKKYSADPYTNYALIYLPDDVLDSSGRCVNVTPQPRPRAR